MYFYTNIIYFSFDFFFFTYSDDEEEKVNGFFFFFFLINGNELAINHNRNVIQCSLQSRAETANYNMSEWKKKLQMGGLLLAKAVEFRISWRVEQAHGPQY